MTQDNHPREIDGSGSPFSETYQSSLLDRFCAIIARRLARAMTREMAVAIDPDTGALLVVRSSDLPAAPRSPKSPVRPLQGRWLPRYVEDLKSDGWGPHV